MKIYKNYLREQIKQLMELTKGKPIIVVCKYKHSDDLKWATFTTVRPYIKNVKTATICNHININRDQISQWYDLNKDLHNRKFYILGYPCIYLHYRVERGCIELAEGMGIKPIVFTEERNLITSRIIEKCYEFDINKHRRSST